MKGFVVGLIVLGGVCLVGGAAILAYGMAKGNINDNFVTNEYKLDGDIDDIEVKVSTADVEIKKAENDQAKVVCVEKEKVYHKATVSNKVLKVEQVDDRKWYQKFLFNWNWKSMKVTIYLPEVAYNDITMDSATGDLTIDKDFTFVNMQLSSDTGAVKINNKVSGDIEVKVHTGSVRLTDAEANNLKVKSSTGDVYLKNSEVKVATDLQSSTGDFNIENVKGGSFKSKASTGHVHLTDAVFENKIEIKTSTGDVIFTRSDAKDIHVETSTGSINGTLLTSKLFSAQSDTGSVKLPSMEEWDQAGGKFEAKSDTGSIDIKIA